jgi:RTX calcium-binding nonapeptide repeat (4 copies)
LSAQSLNLRLLIAACVACGLGVIACASAMAAEVSVEEKLWTPTDSPPSPYGTADTYNKAALVFTAAAGEQNQVTVTESAKNGDLVTLQVIGAGAPLNPGPGCTGGGPPGSPASCTMHAPKPANQIYCGKICVQYEPGSGWLASMRIELSDGDDSFDGSAFRGDYRNAYAELVGGGAGDDRISTGSADDEIDPGTGHDEVHSGEGHDRAFAGPTADGSDLYDLGPGSVDMVSYAARTEPVQADAAGGGAPGEGDRFTGVEFLIGGSAGDVLSGTHVLVGGPGNDRLRGSEGPDSIFGSGGNDTLQGGGGDDNVDGEDGNDLLEGGQGDDRLREEPRATEGDNLSLAESHFGSTTGADVGKGGDGNDILDLGPEDDTERGEAGKDWVYGGSGRDKVYGGPDADIVAGEAGSDRMWGGGGDDLLRSGRNEEHWYASPPRPLDTWSDRVDCGAGRDRASANPWDAVRLCERRSPLPAAGFLRLRRDPAAGTARLSITALGRGSLLVLGRGVSSTELALDGGAHTGRNPLVVPIAARGGALRALRQRGQVTLRVIVKFVPDDGPTRQAGTNVRLVLSR